MPFHKRLVEPRSLGRINRGRLEVNRDVFISLDAVNCQTLINILRQLSDLSRHASSMFVEIQTEAELVINKASALQHRLDSLQDTVRHLSHKRTTIREFMPFMYSTKMCQAHCFKLTSIYIYVIQLIFKRLVSYLKVIIIHTILLTIHTLFILYY